METNASSTQSLEQQIQSLGEFSHEQLLQKYNSVCEQLRNEHPERSTMDPRLSEDILHHLDLLIPDAVSRNVQRNEHGYLSNLKKGNWQLRPAAVVYHFSREALSRDFLIKLVHISQVMEFDEARSKILANAHKRRNGSHGKGVSRTRQFVPNDVALVEEEWKLNSNSELPVRQKRRKVTSKTAKAADAIDAQGPTDDEDMRDVEHDSMSEHTGEDNDEHDDERDDQSSSDEDSSLRSIEIGRRDSPSLSVRTSALKRGACGSPIDDLVKRKLRKRDSTAFSTFDQHDGEDDEAYIAPPDDPPEPIVVDDSSLFYFKNPDDSKLHGCSDLDVEETNDSSIQHPEVSANAVDPAGAAVEAPVLPTAPPPSPPDTVRPNQFGDRGAFDQVSAKPPIQSASSQRLAASTAPTIPQPPPADIGCTDEVDGEEATTSVAAEPPTQPANAEASNAMRHPGPEVFQLLKQYLEKMKGRSGNPKLKTTSFNNVSQDSTQQSLTEPLRGTDEATEGSETGVNVDRMLETISGDAWLNDDACEKTAALWNIHPELNLICHSFIKTDALKLSQNAGKRLRNLQPSHRRLVVFLNHDNTHWTVAVVHRKEQKVCFYDPLHSIKYRCRTEQALKSWLPGVFNCPKSLDGWTWDGAVWSAKQDDASSCGVLCIIFAIANLCQIALPVAPQPALWRKLFHVGLVAKYRPETELSLEQMTDAALHRSGHPALSAGVTAAAGTAETEVVVTQKLVSIAEDKTHAREMAAEGRHMLSFLDPIPDVQKWIDGYAKKCQGLTNYVTGCPFGIEETDTSHSWPYSALMATKREALEQAEPPMQAMRKFIETFQEKASLREQECVDESKRVYASWEGQLDGTLAQDDSEREQEKRRIDQVEADMANLSRDKARLAQREEKAQRQKKNADEAKQRLQYYL